MAADDERTADEIRRRMADLRRELTCDMRDVGRNARAMTDWTFYVRRFPLAVAALALAAGYFLVPRRKQVVRPDPELIAEMVKKRQIRVETKEHSKEQQGLFKTLAMMGVSWAARAGMNYMGERLRAGAIQPRQPVRPVTPVPTPPPTEEQKGSGNGHARQPR